MAKLIGSPPFVGTQDGLTIYRLEGEQYYVRMQSSITGKRIKKDKAFAGFRDSSQRMRIASRLASAVYRQFVVKEYPLYREMTGKAILWLKEGIAASVIEERLQQAYMSKCAVKEAESRSYHASEEKQPCWKVAVKGLFYIPDGVNRTRRRRVVYDKNSSHDKDNRGIYLDVMDFINMSHQHAYQ
ncbi:hypothetical protein SAMN05428988_6292 [Chitinophaga sp. YR573]|uniref:hypothetical protein n=1 Tax=Chitinophaga sp. YR573 TaxID=1881040 RepID=UPI0008AD24DB|nr:hypothetical protein [Chitinophaga sp. YR573]SEW46235.1 hypothetical protein SAMN05428988_6292 [Chitinophaga sp. YR573]